VDDEQELEVIRGQMEETRSSLAGKLEALERTVIKPVETATHAVANTVEAAQEAVTTVKETFDFRHHIQHHPWLAMGGAVLVGFIGGRLLTSANPPLATGAPPPPSGPNGRYEAQPASSSREEEGNGLFGALKGLAIGAAMGLLRDMVAKSAPQNLASDLVKWVDDATTRLGGKPVDPYPEQQPQGNRTHERSWAASGS
jgi:ElaB/YqjD/DUF883 family membrane-anchored ribosome-binding protein